MTDDWFELLDALAAAEARFLVVGAHAMAVHGVPRATQDLDIWIDRSPANAARVWRALASFGAPIEALGLKPSDFEAADRVVQLGLPPNRIDIMTDISGVSGFAQAWEKRHEASVRGQPFPFLSRADLIANKRATDRPKDLADLTVLEGRDG